MKTQPTKLTEAAVTPEAVYLNRRQYLKASALGLGAAAFSGASQAADDGQLSDPAPSWMKTQLNESTASPFSTNEALTPYEYVTGYNNFYEFGTDKSDPEKYGQGFEPHPWSVMVSGAAEKTGTFDLEDVLKGLSVEERIYRFRCVEAWSMVVPWIGFPLSALLKRFAPRAEGRFVEFKTLYRRSEMRGTRSFTSVIDWPYREGLRLDEAMHPLTLMAVGLYGKTLPNQNGAPLRLVVPWKYGFKSIKSIVEINVTAEQPETSWQTLQPSEYGFYANVNPEVDHPRWSQRFERKLPSSIFKPNRVPTLPFNGYREQVAGLYEGMDLRQFY